VKAVNLIPPEQRRGGSGPGRSGGAIYMVLAAAGLIVVATAVYVLTANSVTNRQDELTKLQAQTQAAQARANALSPYKQFQSLKQARVTTIQQLASSRFDWERVMRKLAIVIPPDVWLTSLVGTVSPDVSVASSSSGGSSSMRGAMPVPAVELAGCTTGQAQVSRFMSRLRAIDGVTRVSLSSSEKQDNGGGTVGASSGGGSAASGACSGGPKGYPQFDMVIFFGGAAQAAPGVGGASGGTTPTPAPQSGPATSDTAAKGPK
jgi:Tfp pilus assembly protein PilN